MSKIICDVCGTAYSDTASQCPICGTAKNDKSKTFSTATADGAAAGSYIKGGRFSHANVRKRNSGKELPVVKAAPVKEEPQQKPAVQEKPAPAPAPAPVAPQPVKEVQPPVRKQPEERKPEPAKRERPAQPRRERSVEEKKENRKSNIVLIFLVIILLLSIIFICTYIADRYLQNWGNDDTKPSDPVTTPSTSESTGPVEGVRIPCSSIVLPEQSLTLSSEEGAQKFVLQIFPETCTDTVSIVSSDESILTIDADGMMTVLSSGEVTITVVCGDQTATCTVTAVYVDPTEPTPPPTEPSQPTEPPKILELAYSDITLRGYEATWKIYNGEIDPGLITFTSSDPSIVTVSEKGVVKVLANGTVTITAEYEGQKKECIVRCKDVVKTTHKLTYTDVTIVVGERFTLQLLNAADGTPIQNLVWTVSMDGYVEIEPNAAATGLRVKGLEVTGAGVYYVTVSTEYEGVTYSCKVRVKAAPET